MDGGFLAILVAGGSAALGIASLLWALRVTDGARGGVEAWKKKYYELETKIAISDAVFGAHPGVVLIWDETQTDAHPPWGKPRIYGSALALASLLRFSDAASAADPAVRILQGLSAFDAHDATGAAARLAPALNRLRNDGQAFSLAISTPGGVFVEVDGRTAGPRAVLWIIDTSVRGVEEGGARGRLDSDSHKIVARDPAAFLEMVERAPFMVWRVNGALKLEWANHVYLEALEAKSLAQAVSRNLQFDQAAIDLARQAIESGEIAEDIRPATVNGQRRVLRIIMTPVSGAAAGIAIDVTEAETSRDALARQQRAHDETLNHLGEAVAVFDANKRLAFYNRAFEQLWGLDPAFLADRPSHAAWLDHLKEKRKLPAHANYAEWRAGELARHQQTEDFPETLWVLPDARTLRIACQRHPNGGLLMVFADITNELTLKSQYHALLQTQRAALDKLHEAVIVFGLDGRLKLCNAAFLEVWRLDNALVSDDMPFDHVVDICRPLFADRNAWAQIRARITDPSPEARIEFRGEMRLTNNTILKFLTRPLPDGATLVAFQDITADRRVAEALHDRAEAFEAADKLKTRFVENVSYQLRNPLQAIHGNAEMLQHRLFGPLNDRQIEQVGAIIEASGNLSKLIDNILDVALVEAGGVQLDLDDVDVRQLIDDSVQLAASKAEDTEVPIRVQCPADIGTMTVDPKRMKQVLVNLLSNALKHTGRGDEITIGAERIEGVMSLFVTDTGEGVDPEVAPRVFDSFQSGDRHGAGLGLALVRSFVEMHGGWVAMSSEPGRGATVTCHLPIHAPAAGPPPIPPGGNDPRPRAA